MGYADSFRASVTRCAIVVALIDHPTARREKRSRTAGRTELTLDLNAMTRAIYPISDHLVLHALVAQGPVTDQELARIFTLRHSWLLQPQLRGRISNVWKPPRETPSASNSHSVAQTLALGFCH